MTEQNWTAEFLTGFQMKEGDVFTYNDRKWKLTKSTACKISVDEMRPWLKVDGYSVEAVEVTE
jgi:hypothetical protein